MKRHLSLLALVLCLGLAFSSCSTEKSVIKDLNSLNDDLQANGDNYTISDWKDFAQDYKKVLEKSQKCDFSSEQRKEVTELNTQITTGMAKKATKSVVKTGLTWAGVFKSIAKGFSESFGESIQDIIKAIEDFGSQDDD